MSMRWLVDKSDKKREGSTKTCFSFHLLSFFSSLHLNLCPSFNHPSIQWMALASGRTRWCTPPWSSPACSCPRSWSTSWRWSGRWWWASSATPPTSPLSSTQSSTPSSPRQLFLVLALHPCGLPSALTSHRLLTGKQHNDHMHVAHRSNAHPHPHSIVGLSSFSAAEVKIVIDLNLEIFY